MNDQETHANERGIWSWTTIYILLQWPFIIVGILIEFIYEGLELGWYTGKEIQKRVEDRAP